MKQDEWLKILGPTDTWNERHLLAMFAVFGVPDGYFDVGSGTGAMVNMARKFGVEAFGVDQIERPESYLYVSDLTKTFELPYLVMRRFGIVSCLEVAEHLPPECDSIICDTIARHASRWVVFSSAHPGQGGDDHIGIRPVTHWRTLMFDRGLQFDDVMTTRLSLAWLNIHTPHYWLPDNVMVFHR